MSQPPAHYRPDIDGLRALAVTAVVLFHAGLTGLGGGYAGVDVFFVISGFLITGIIRREQEQNTFTLRGFYERRARRILPALFGVLLFCLIAGPLFMRPWDLADLGRSMKYAIGSVSNIFFSRVTTDYFGADVETMPLLHTWSLGVEEQFYIVIPLLMLLLARGTRRDFIRRVVFILVALASLAWSAWLVREDRTRCFYLLPGRAWELALGGLLALFPAPRLPSAVRHTLGLAGLLMILATFFIYSPLTLFPGPSAVLPCVGTALVIFAGSSGPNAAGLLLGLRPVVFIGLISYSVYLWHWPLLTFAKHVHLRSTSWPAWINPSLVVLSFVLGWLSWRWIESPFRERKKWSRRGIFTFSLTGLIVLFGCAMIVQKTNLFFKLLPPEASRIAAFRQSKNPLGDEAFADNAKAEVPFIYGDRTVPPRTALWGDSHANALAYTLHERALAAKQSFRFYGRSGTVPLPDTPPFPDRARREGQAYTGAVLKELLKDDQIRTVILAARWAFYVEGTTAAYGPAESGPNRSGGMLAADDPRTAFANALRALIAKLQQSGKTVVLVYPIPEPARRVPQFLAEEVLNDRDPAAARIPAAGVFFERQQFVLETMAAQPDSPQLIRIKPHERLIRDGALVLMNGQSVLYRDADHLTLEGVQFILPLFEPVFARWSTPP